jgi:hypothetical protein
MRARGRFDRAANIAGLQGLAALLSLGAGGCGGEYDAGPSAGEPAQTVVSKIEGNDSDFLFFQSIDIWAGAQGMCPPYANGNWNYHLARPINPEEQAFVRRQMGTHGGGKWWIGYSDSLAEGLWQWQSPNKVQGYVNWNAGEPATAVGDEDCAVIDTDTGYWSAVNCVGNQFKYICKRDDDNPLPATSFCQFSANNTNNATQNYTQCAVTLGANQGVTFGTCGLTGASVNGDSYVRLFYPDNVTEVAFGSNDDSCDGTASSVSYVVPTAGTYIIHVGCYSDEACDGSLGIRKEIFAR